MQEADGAMEFLPDSFHPEMQIAMNAMILVDSAKWQHSNSMSKHVEIVRHRLFYIIDVSEF